MANNPTTGENQYGIAEQGLDGHAFLNSLTNLQATQGATQQQTGTGTTAAGAGSLENLMSFFQNILGGGGNAQQELAPQSEQVLSQYDSARKALATTSARGGGTNSQFLSLTTDPLSQIAKLTSDARSGAASSIGNIGSLLTQTGTTESNIGVGELANAGGVANTRNQIEASSGFGNAFKNAFGSALGNTLGGGNVQISKAV